MTLPQDIEIEERYTGNSGDPAIVLGAAGSGRTIDYGFSVRDIVANAINAYVCRTGTEVGDPLDLISSTFMNLYVSTSRGTATPVGAVSERTKSPEQVAFEGRKARLVRAIKVMRSAAPNWSGDQPTKVKEVSAQSAERFLESLPGNAILPRVAPDGEGDVIFVWDKDGQPNCVVTVENRMLHLASGLGTANVQHVDGKRFLGVQIPRPILERIPHR